MDRRNQVYLYICNLDERYLVKLKEFLEERKRLFPLHFLFANSSKMFNMAFEFTDDNFTEKAAEEGVVAVVDFWAEWCGPCRMISPIIEQLSEEYQGKVLVGKVDVDANPKISMEYGIRSIPTVLILKDGQIFDKQVGATSKKVLTDKIERALAPV